MNFTYVKGQLPPQRAKALKDFSSLTNSQVVRKKKPRTKVSFLKNLMSENLSTQGAYPHIDSRVVSKQRVQQQTAFKKSNIILHSSKLITNSRSKQNSISYQYGDEMNTKADEVIQRYKKLYNQDIFKQKKTTMKENKQQKNSFNQIRAANPIQNKSIIQTKQKICPSNQLSKTQPNIIPSSISGPKLDKKEPQGVPTRKKGSLTYHIKLSQNQQIKQLKLIGHLLNGIKKQIIVNRSVIIEGLKQIQKVNRRSQNAFRPHNNSMVECKNPFPMSITQIHEKFKNQSYIEEYRGNKPLIQYSIKFR